MRSFVFFSPQTSQYSQDRMVKKKASMRSSAEAFSMLVIAVEYKYCRMHTGSACCEDFEGSKLLYPFIWWRRRNVSFPSLASLGSWWSEAVKACAKFPKEEAQDSTLTGGGRWCLYLLILLFLMASMKALSSCSCSGGENWSRQKSLQIPTDWRKSFHLDKVHSCFSDVPETTAANWAIFAEEMRSMSVSHLVVPRLLNQTESVRDMRTGEEKIIHGQKFADPWIGRQHHCLSLQGTIVSRDKLRIPLLMQQVFW